MLALTPVKTISDLGSMMYEDNHATNTYTYTTLIVTRISILALIIVVGMTLKMFGKAFISTVYFS